MRERIHRLFDSIQAEESLKNTTARRLHAEIEKRQKVRAAKTTRLLPACAGIFLVLIGCFTSLSLYFSPHAFIDLDVNPSIELTLNRFGRVIHTTAYAEADAELLRAAKIQHLPYADALNALVNALASQNLLTSEALLSITVQSDDADEQQTLLNALSAAVATALRQQQANPSVDLFGVTKETKQYAHEHHMSPAKYLAITDLQAFDPSATLETCRGRTIGELKQMTQEHEQRCHEAAAQDEAQSTRQRHTCHTH